MTQDDIREGPSPYAAALIRLLQGIVYADDDVWGLVLRYQTPISTYFTQMGVQLYLNENEGFAYLTQPDEEELGITAPLPRLVRRRALSYSVTVLLVLLREELNQFDTTDVDNYRLILAREALLTIMQPFYAQQEDERARLKLMERDLNQVVEFGFLKEIKREKQIDYLVRPVLKAKIDSDQLELIKQRLAEHGERADND
ncbi:MAG: DUF4194 domain-containing protein [Anaerolinea sp.]|nr:DUF4194 domain-containing protein [Anaerolinea sp.]